MTHINPYTNTRYARISARYAADALDLTEEANTLTGKEREIAELCAEAARQLSRWHALKSHTARSIKAEEGA